MSTNPTLRPRTRRLISIEDGTDNELPRESQATSASQSSQHQQQQTRALQKAVSSAFSGARAPSPLPARHLSRGTSPFGGSSPGREQARSFGLQIPAGQRKSTSIWESSWAGLQGVASSLLGNNVTDPDTPTAPGGNPRKGSKGAGKGTAHKRNYSLSVPDEPWGPDAPMTIDTLATGSREERLAKVQAEKRKKLLAGLGDEARDASGRYKRRNSLERRDSIPSPTLGNDDALVYVHKVRPSDSVAGLSVRYNCSQAVVRKTNRLWVNDSIQIRKFAYLPVDACAVRGMKTDGPGQKNSELLAGVEEVPQQKGNGNDDYHIPVTARQPESSESKEEQPWTHDSWVQLPSSSDPVEIGRIPRQMLGWFPPARRKSTSYSDASPPSSILSDRPRTDASPIPGSPPQLQGSPSRIASPARRPTRPSRASSNASRLNPSFQPTFRGTGGIGSLHSNVRGAPPDELNKFVATHLPLLSIQSPDSSIKNHAHSRSATMPLRPGTAGPRMSFDRVSSLSTSDSVTSVEAMAGAVEGWLRKAGGKVKGSLGTPEMRGRGRANTGDADLIELTDSWELNGSPARTPRGTDAWESEGHGVLDHPARTAKDEEERLLRERFPPAGKVFETGIKK